MTAIIAATASGLIRIETTTQKPLLMGSEAFFLISEPDIIIATLGTKGLAISHNHGESWEICHNLPYAPVSVARSPHNRNVLLAGTQPAALLISKNLGLSWELLCDFSTVPGTENWEIPIRDPNKKEISEAVGEGAAAWNIVFDPTCQQRLIVGVEVGGILVSDDFGKTWRIEVVGESPDPHVICLHPQNSSISLTSTGYSRFTEKRGVFRYAHSGGVYRSMDGFRSFTSVWPIDPEPQYTRAMCWDARHPFPVTVCVRSSYVQPSNPEGKRLAAVKQSLDLGETWINLGSDDFAAYDEEFSSIMPDPNQVGNVIVGTEKGKLFKVSAKKNQWHQLADLKERINFLSPY